MKLKGNNKRIMYYNGLQRIQLWFFPLKDERPKKKEREIEWIIFIQALLCIRILTSPIKIEIRKIFLGNFA